MEMTPNLKKFLDYAIFPAYLACTLVETSWLIKAGLPCILVGGIVTATMAVAAAILEQLRPERVDFNVLCLPLRTELAHYLFNFNIGYAVGLIPLVALAAAAAKFCPDAWPTGWPLALQVVMATFLGEAVSYWQHRLIHRIDWLWPFHALHHSGATLNLYRSARFHFVDLASAFFLLALPLVLLRAPEVIFAWTAAIYGAISVMQHSNVRLTTPPFLDRVICTPAVHRYHHSSDKSESDGNFGTQVMLIDQLFGTFIMPSKAGPAVIGIENDRTRPGFWAQTLDPFMT